jgi:transposase-like protein
VWRYVYRAVDQHGQVIDVLLTARRDAAAARRFFTRARQTDRTAQVIITGHALVQNLRRGHYDIALDTAPATRLAAAFTELARAI